MLCSLHIESYALIDRLDLAFGPGLNVLTGETGSGKSIVVDALGLMLGEKAESAVVRHGEERALVSGVFRMSGAARTGLLAALQALGLNDGDEEGNSQRDQHAALDVIIRREISSSGRGRVFINDQPATVAALKRLAPWLGAVHSQNEALVAFAPAAQLELLDEFAGPHLAAHLKQVADAFTRWRSCAGRVAELESDDQKKLQEADLWRFQKEELEAAQPRRGEDAELEQERQTLANAEKICAQAQLAYSALYDSPEAAIAALKSASKAVQELSRWDKDALELLPRLEALRTEVDDVAASLRPWLEGIEVSPERLAWVEERLVLLDRLKRKYGPDLDAVLKYQQELANKLDSVERSEYYLQQAREELRQACDLFTAAASGLSSQRAAAAQKLAKETAREANDLAMRVELKVAQESFPDDPAHWSETGWDRVVFLASTNPGEPMQPLQAIASGGELSRVLLALHVVIQAGAPGANPGRKKSTDRNFNERTKDADAVRTLVFDEVDAGIGGRAAEAVGRKLQQLSAAYQVLCVTHLPQIATFGHHHLRVEKTQQNGRSLTRVQALDGAARVEEIARMLAGDAGTEISRKHAEELLRAHA